LYYQPQIHRPCQSGVKVLPYPCKDLVHEPTAFASPENVFTADAGRPNLSRIATYSEILKDAAGRRPDGEYLHTIFALCTTGAKTYFCAFRRRPFSTAVTAEASVNEERTAKF
jgi:hypothetical protein